MIRGTLYLLQIQISLSTFVCCRWLHDEKDDGLTERLLSLYHIDKGTDNDVQGSNGNASFRQSDSPAKDYDEADNKGEMDNPDGRVRHEMRDKVDSEGEAEVENDLENEPKLDSEAVNKDDSEGGVSVKEDGEANDNEEANMEDKDEENVEDENVMKQADSVEDLQEAEKDHTDDTGRDDQPVNRQGTFDNTDTQNEDDSGNRENIEDTNDSDNKEGEDGKLEQQDKDDQGSEQPGDGRELNETENIGENASSS